MSNRWPPAERKAARPLREAEAMATTTITRIDVGKTGAGQTSAEQVDWLARADHVARKIADPAAKHDADDSFVSEGYALLKEEGFFRALSPAEPGGRGAASRAASRAVRRM